MITVDILIAPLRILVTALGTGVLPAENPATMIRSASTDLDEVRRIATMCGARYMGAERAEEFGARNGVTGELGIWIEPSKVIASLDVTA